ncbi:MAG: helix-turn-helix transcriptional regulator [Fidelibacterota bacterium]|nr:MAG: helix-turn-helix transcriptional regulator [Candidatus Neomarinimicrobiota bacterium]
MGIEKLEAIVNEIPVERKRFLRTKFHLAARISQIIKKKGLTQDEVAKRAGLRASFMSRLISPSHNPTLKTISRIEQALDEPLLEITSETSQDEKWSVYVEGWRDIEEATLPSPTEEVIWQFAHVIRSEEAFNIEDDPSEFYQARRIFPPLSDQEIEDVGVVRTSGDALGKDQDTSSQWGIA